MLVLDFDARYMGMLEEAIKRAVRDIALVESGDYPEWFRDTEEPCGRGVVIIGRSGMPVPVAHARRVDLPGPTPNAEVTAA